jgi:hypothetical protein
MARVSYPPVKAGHLLIDGAILASVIGKKLCAFLQCKMSMMAHRIISRQLKIRSLLERNGHH